MKVPNKDEELKQIVKQLYKKGAWVNSKQIHEVKQAIKSKNEYFKDGIIKKYNR